MTTRTRGPLPALPTGVWLLGFVSLLMDTSSELAHSLLPLYMTTVLGASMVALGLIEGVAEATASVVKVFSGVLSDRWRRRKALVVTGYGLAALSKPIFPLASSLGWVLTARLIDRVGKGIRGAPRDALIADITPAELRGRAYGLRQALDSIGAVAGPLLAVLLMTWLAGDVRTVLWASVVPAVLAVVLLTSAVREPPRADPPPAAATGVAWGGIARLSPRYWRVVVLASVFTLARFSEAFLLLRAQDVGMIAGHVPVVMVVMNLVYAALAFPAGVAADRVGPRRLLAAGLWALVLADVVLALSTTPSHVLVGASCWGLHMALTQGLFSKLIADEASADQRGTAFGVFNLVTGAALLAASATAGWLWSTAGPGATFTAGAVFATLAALGVVAYRPRRRT